MSSADRDRPTRRLVQQRGERVDVGAGGLAGAGDLDTAVVLGHQAVDTITGMSSRRSYARLGVLREVLEPMRAGPGVADLRDRLATGTAA